MSLTPAFRGESLKRNTIYWEHEGNRAIREGDRKLVARENKPWELYDLSEDRSELHDLSGERPDEVERLEAKWTRWAVENDVLPLSGWRGEKKKKSAANRTRFELGPDAELSGFEVPHIGGKPFTVEIEIAEPGTDGVLAAQGGHTHGWAVYMRDGDLTAAVRRNGQLIGGLTPEFGKPDFTFSMTPPDAVPGRLQVVRLDIGRSAGLIQIDDEPGETSVSPRPTRSVTFGPMGFRPLITTTPADGLTVGRDGGDPVGEYESPFAFNGTIGSVTVNLGDAAE